MHVMADGSGHTSDGMIYSSSGELAWFCVDGREGHLRAEGREHFSREESGGNSDVSTALCSVLKKTCIRSAGLTCELRRTFRP